MFFKELVMIVLFFLQKNELYFYLIYESITFQCARSKTAEQHIPNNTVEIATVLSIIWQTSTPNDKSNEIHKKRGKVNQHFITTKPHQYIRCVCRWVKFGKLKKMVFVGKDVITYGQGCYMIFITVETGKTEIYSADLRESGLGIRCYIGHRLIPIFGFAESDCNPHIYVYSYPELNQICKLGGK